MTEQVQQPQLTQAQQSEWARIQFQKANKHLAENGVLFESVVTDESRYLAPYLAVWKIKAIDGAFYWAISGDLPSDYTALENAANVKEVLRHFGMTWQLKAENLLQAAGDDATQKEYAELLQNRAESLFAMQNAPQLWG